MGWASYSDDNEDRSLKSYRDDIPRATPYRSALVGRKIHRVAADVPDGRPVTALCGKAIPAMVMLMDPEQTAREIARNRRLVCDQCDCLVREACKPPDDCSDMDERGEFTSEQLALRDALEQERRRRQKLQQQEVRDRASRTRSRSVRAVRGGLPSLGRDR